jgi:large subunit ribosomal protein L3
VGIQGGHYGNERVTVLNLQVFSIQPEKNLLLVRGAVPGARNGFVFVRRAVKKGNGK